MAENGARDPAQSYLSLKIKIVNAKGLRNADYFNNEGAGLNQGVSDPYCTCEVVGKPYSRFSTEVLMDTLNPEWKHKAVVVDFEVGDSLLFCVWDRDWMKFDDFLGKVVLTSEQFYPLGFVGTLPLLHEDRNDTSDLGTLSIEVKPVTSWEEVPSGLGLRRQIYMRYRRMSEKHPDSVTGLGVRKHLKMPFKKIGEVYQKTRREAKANLLDMTRPMVRQVLVSAGETLQLHAIEDPDMPAPVRSCLGRFVEEIWHDILTEVEYAFEEARWGVARDTWHDVLSLAQVGERPCCCSPQWFRALVLYHFLPYDKSIFGCVWDPVFLFFCVVSVIPLIRVWFFALILILLTFPCPPDEFQLVQLILQFKGIQFLSSGAGAAFSGGMQYYMCVQDDGAHSCDVSGPGTQYGFEVDLADLCGSCLLVWVAFLLLPVSRKSAGLRKNDAADYDSNLEADIDHQNRGHGGRLQRLLVYDLLCFAISTSLLLVLEGLRYRRTVASFDLHSLHGHLQSWQFRATLFWARVFYSLLALPFTIFNIPVFQTILTHTVPTGFNRRGAVVTYVLPPMPKEVNSGGGAAEREAQARSVEQDALGRRT